MVTENSSQSRRGRPGEEEKTILPDSKARPHCSTSTPCRRGISRICSLATTVAIGSRVLDAGNTLFSSCKMGRSRVERNIESWCSWERMRMQSDRRVGWRRMRSGQWGFFTSESLDPCHSADAPTKTAWRMARAMTLIAQSKTAIRGHIESRSNVIDPSSSKVAQRSTNSLASFSRRISVASANLASAALSLRKTLNKAIWTRETRKSWSMSISSAARL